MRKWGKIAGAIGVVLIAAFVATAVLVTQYDYNQLKPTIAEMVKDATGRDLVINGNLDLAVSLAPTLVVSDIAFANAPWGEKGDMVRLDKLAAKVDLLALLQGRVDVDYLVLNGLKVVLQTDGKGRANWEFETPDTAEPSTSALSSGGEGDLKLVRGARDIRLMDVDVTYIDGATGKRLRLLLERADFVAENFNAPMHATLSAAYQGVGVAAVVDMGSLGHLVGSAGGAFPVSMEITAPGLKATVKGSVEQPQAGLTVNARADLAVSDTATLAKLAGVALPNLDGLKVGANITGGGTRYAFTALDVRANGSDLGGDVTVTLAGTRPLLSGKLTSKVLDLNQILNIAVPKAATGAGQGSTVPLLATTKPPGAAPVLFSAEPLALDGLKAVDLKLNVRVGRVKLSSMNVDALQAGVKLNGGKLDVHPLSLSVKGGGLDASVRLDGAALVPALTLKSTVRSLDIGQVLAALGQGDVLTLPLSGTVDVATVGTSMQQLMGNMNGSVRFSGHGGQIHDTAITRLITGLGNDLPWIKNEDAGRITCLVADWPVQNGIATAHTVLADTPSFAVAVTGNVDLGGERLHLTVIPQAKSASLASFAVPMRIKGALSAPYVDVSPADAVVGTVGNIFKAPVSLLISIFGINDSNNKAAQAKDPCFQALGGGKTTPPPASTPPAAPPTPGSTLQPLKPIEDLGQSLESLFGK